MTLNSINTRADLDALLGTPKHAVAMTMLGGTLWRLEKDDAAKSWTAVLDEATIERFGLTIADFTNVSSPELPEYVETISTEHRAIIAESSAYLVSTDWLVVRRAENGTPIPADILTKRAEARASIV